MSPQSTRDTDMPTLEIKTHWACRGERGMDVEHHEVESTTLKEMILEHFENEDPEYFDRAETEELMESGRWCGGRWSRVGSSMHFEGDESDVYFTKKDNDEDKPMIEVTVNGITRMVGLGNVERREDGEVEFIVETEEGQRIVQLTDWK